MGKKLLWLVAAALLVWLLLVPLRPLTLTCMGAAALAYILLPLCRRLEERFPPAWAALGAVLILIFTLGGLSALMLPSLVAQGRNLLQRIPSLWESAAQIYSRFSQQMEQSMGLHLPAMGDGVSSLLADWAEKQSLPPLEKLSLFLLLPVILYYFLRDRTKLYRRFLYMIPSGFRSRICDVLHRIHRRLSRYLLAQLLVAVFVGGLTFASLALAGIPYALVLGAVMMFAEIIPYFGPWIGALPIALVAFPLGWKKLLLSLLAVVLVQQAENLFITPWITGSQLQLHPLAVMLSVLAGGMLCGVAGMLLALPLVIILRECAGCFLIRHRERD